MACCAQQLSIPLTAGSGQMYPVGALRKQPLTGHVVFLT